MVFFDDAEGDYKAYTQRKSFSYSSVAKHGGKKGIFAYVYYLIPSVLEFSCNLAAPAKLAFWYKANGFYPSDKMLLYINGSLTTTWTTQSDWVYAEYSLTAGNTVIQFSFDEANSIHSIDTNVYFALDDLMVVYE
jgi:hypothetical protein